MDYIIDAFQKYYGLDWLALISGLTGMYMLTQRNRTGFLINMITCFCGFCVALLSSQFGFVTYNSLLFLLAVQGYFNWAQDLQPVRAHTGEVLSSRSQQLMRLKTEYQPPKPPPVPLCADERHSRSARNPHI